MAPRPLKNPLASWAQLDQLMGCALCCDRGGNVSYSLRQTSNRRPNKNKNPNYTLFQPLCAFFIDTAADFVYTLNYDVAKEIGQ